MTTGSSSDLSDKVCIACGFEVYAGDDLTIWHPSKNTHGEDGELCEVCWEAAPLSGPRGSIAPLDRVRSFMAKCTNLILREQRDSSNGERLMTTVIANPKFAFGKTEALIEQVWADDRENRINQDLFAGFPKKCPPNIEMILRMVDSMIMQRIGEAQR